MFRGFTDETVDFMWGIRFNNERPWFEEHKEMYLNHLYRPMRELCDEVYDYLHEKAPDLGLSGRVCRIYRDARRLHGRGPYKDHLWFTIERRADDPGCSRPALWFELTPDGWSYGMGYWMPKPVTMAKLRARISRDPDGIRSLMRRLEEQGEFRLWTEQYKRPKGTPPAEDLELWFRAKSLSFGHEEPLTEELFQPELAERLKQGLEFLLPYYDYFLSLEGEPDPNAET